MKKNINIAIFIITCITIVALMTNMTNADDERTGIFREYTVIDNNKNNPETIGEKNTQGCTGCECNNSCDDGDGNHSWGNSSSNSSSGCSNGESWQCDETEVWIPNIQYGSPQCKTVYNVGRNTLPVFLACSTNNSNTIDDTKIYKVADIIGMKNNKQELVLTFPNETPVVSKIALEEGRKSFIKNLKQKDLKKPDAEIGINGTSCSYSTCYAAPCSCIGGKPQTADHGGAYCRKGILGEPKWYNDCSGSPFNFSVDAAINGVTKESNMKTKFATKGAPGYNGCNSCSITKPVEYFNPSLDPFGNLDIYLGNDNAVGDNLEITSRSPNGGTSPSGDYTSYTDITSRSPNGGTSPSGAYTSYTDTPYTGYTGSSANRNTGTSSSQGLSGNTSGSANSNQGTSKYTFTGNTSGSANSNQGTNQGTSKYTFGGNTSGSANSNTGNKLGAGIFTGSNKSSQSTSSSGGSSNTASSGSSKKGGGGSVNSGGIGKPSNMVNFAYAAKITEDMLAGISEDLLALASVPENSNTGCTLAKPDTPECVGNAKGIKNCVNNPDTSKYNGEDSAWSAHNPNFNNHLYGYCLLHYKDKTGSYGEVNGTYKIESKYDENFMTYGAQGEPGEYKSIVINTLGKDAASIEVIPGRGGSAGTLGQGQNGLDGNKSYIKLDGKELAVAEGGKGGRGSIPLKTMRLPGFRCSNSDGCVYRNGDYDNPENKLRKLSNSAEFLPGGNLGSKIIITKSAIGNVLSGLIEAVSKISNHALASLLPNFGQSGNGGYVMHNCWAGQWIVKMYGNELNTSIHPNDVPDGCYADWKNVAAGAGIDGAVIISW